MEARRTRSHSSMGFIVAVGLTDRHKHTHRETERATCYWCAGDVEGGLPTYDEIESSEQRAYDGHFSFGALKRVGDLVEEHPEREDDPVDEEIAEEGREHDDPTPAAVRRDHHLRQHDHLVLFLCGLGLARDHRCCCFLHTSASSDSIWHRGGTMRGGAAIAGGVFVRHRKAGRRACFVPEAVGN